MKDCNENPFAPKGKRLQWKAWSFRVVLSRKGTPNFSLHKYFYYLHGPLARVETGHDKVQGTDYAYTLHGWIKGVNSNVLKDANDIGKDGRGALTTSGAYVNKFNGRDVFGYSLTYYNNATQKDYSGINGLSGTSTDFIAAAPSVQTADLYNGNIRQMVASYLDASSPDKTYGLASLLKNFSYDQLNRIAESNSNNSLNASTNAWGTATGGARYLEQFTYDQNGNIKKAKRNGDVSGSLAMDDLTYHYTAGTNQLDYVKDDIGVDPYSSDIGTQAVHNYTYDAIGNLTKDQTEGITDISWNVYGKIKQITFGNGKPNLLFRYDASGNRVSKTSFMGAVPASTATTTYYVRDAQGNVMATYEQKPDIGNNPAISLTERHIYGSSRLGLETTILNVTTYSNTLLNTTSVTRTLGYRSYEMTNHLGNVLAVVSDRKISVDVANDGTTDYFTGEVLSANDYYAFGGTMPGRSFNGGYRYGFNGKEKDLETSSTSTYDYGFRIYNPALGRFLSVDPLSHAYPWFTPYQFAGNTPISAIDLDGLENVFVCENDNNQGECMEVVYTAEDIANIINDKKPEFKVHYPDGKVTSQFEGPNKANEKKVFQGVKPLIESAGVKLYGENLPDGEKRDFSYIRNDYEVPAPAPVRPRQPTSKLTPIVPPLNIEFVGGSNEFKNPSQVESIVKPVADYLIKNPKTKINLSGNTGLPGVPNAPTGSGVDVLNYPAPNPNFSTVGILMKARAEAVKTYLINKYKIDPSRISTSTGTQTLDESGRNVSVKGSK